MYLNELKSFPYKNLVLIGQFVCPLGICYSRFILAGGKRAEAQFYINILETE